MTLMLVPVAACDLYFGSPPHAVPPADATAPSPPLFEAPVTYSADGPTAIAVGDVDGDGRPDLVVAGGSDADIDVFLNTGGGAFGAGLITYAGSCPLGVTLGDFDGTGTLEAATADCEDGTFVFGDMGVGGFGGASRIVVGGYPNAIASGDFDHDGRADLAVASYAPDGVSVLLATGSGGFAPPIAYGSVALDAIAVGDVDGDGNPDLVTATSGAYGADGTVNVLLGNGDGTFQPPASFPVGIDPQSVALADLNGDGWLDAVTANPALVGGVSVVFGRGDGTFGPPASDPGPASEVAVADVDGDGAPDLVVATNGGSFDVRFNAGDGTFATSATYPCGGCGRLAVADVNGDGKPDVIGIDVSVDELGITAGANVSVMLHAP